MSLVDLDPSLSAPGVHNVLRMLEAVLPIDSSARSTDQRTKLSVRPEGCGGVEADVVLHVPLRGRQTCGSVRNEALWFSDDPSVPWPYRGRKLTLPAIQAHPLQPRADESVLMWRNREALWTVSGSDKQTVFRTAFPLPSLGEGGSLSEPLDPQRMPSTLPLVHSFHHAYAEELYANPPLRASFVFDDPNLHWPSYGRVNYKEIAARAESLGYHVGFATIPLDAWVTHQATAALFRAKADRLSLVVHGNNHTKHELARAMSDAQRAWLLDQAATRIDALESKSGLSVGRIMIPPHGACSSEILRALPEHGFEAACISTGSLQAHNRGQPWTLALGFAPTEVIFGCPVMPRWALSQSSDALLMAAAYLGRPLILRAHHQDLNAGLEILDSAAKSINRLGSVHWRALTEVSQLNSYSRMQGSTVRIRPLALRVDLQIHASATHLSLDVPDPTEWQIHEGNEIRTFTPDGHLDIRGSGGRLRIERITLKRRSTSRSHWARTAPRYILRRALAEARDRLLPA